MTMQASRILPDLQCSLVCEDIRQEVTGNFILVGVINFVRVPKLPVVALKLSVFSRWTAGVGEFVEKIRLVGPDQVTEIRKAEVRFALKDPNHHATNVSVFGQVEFKVPGNYFVEVSVDDVMKLRYPVPVVLALPPEKGKPAKPPEPPAS